MNCCIYNNKVNNTKFDSRKESKRYYDLKQRQLDGQVKYFLRKPPFDLGRYGIYRCDFLIVWADDSVTFENATSRPYLLTKQTMAEQLYDIRID